MILTTQLTQQDYIRISFFLQFRKLTVLFVMAAILVWLVVYLVMNLQSSDGKLFNLIPISIGLLVIPGMTYLTAKRNFKGISRISEPIEYQVKKDGITLQGESFTTDYKWNQLYRVSKNKHFVLIWQTPQVANFIPLRNISESQLAELKRVLDRNLIANKL
ncbi:MAG TPA: YcxB family protein [Fluviicola sp.]|nr:YcxB family protein [Fluviicola sp.]